MSDRRLNTTDGDTLVRSAGLRSQKGKKFSLTTLDRTCREIAGSVGGWGSVKFN